MFLKTAQLTEHLLIKHIASISVRNDLTVMTAWLLLKPESGLTLSTIAEKFLKFVRCNANGDVDADVDVDIDVDDAVDHSSKTERLKSVFQGKLQFLLRLFLILS